MFCEKLDIPPLPDDIIAELIEVATTKFNSEEEFEESYNNEHDGAKVSFYPVPPKLYDRIQELLYQYEETKDHRHFFIQLVHGGTALPLHVDAYDQRATGINFMLQTGGDNVVTKWYDVKEEFQGMHLPGGVPLDENMFDLAESHVMEVNNWYYMVFNHVHNAENIQGLRLSLAVMFHDFC